MTTYAKCARYDEGDSFAYVHKTAEYSEDQYDYYECDETLYECWQPDALDNDEFNVVIILECVPVLVQGINFDFIEVE